LSGDEASEEFGDHDVMKEEEIFLVDGSKAYMICFALIIGGVMGAVYF
jgi:hypothetical protein